MYCERVPPRTTRNATSRQKAQHKQEKKTQTKKTHHDTEKEKRFKARNRA